MNKDDEGSGYEVGYGRPPKATQFKPGHSGNRKGRPKKSKNFTTVLLDELKSEVVITENGARKRITKREVIGRQLVNQAAQGDTKAQTLLFAEMRQREPTGEGANDSRSGVGEFRPEDQRVLENFLMRARFHQDAERDAAENSGDTSSGGNHD